MVIVIHLRNRYPLLKLNIKIRYYLWVYTNDDNFPYSYGLVLPTLDNAYANYLTR